MHKILIVEDDETIFLELKKLLVKNGYAVLDGRIWENIASDFDLAVLDIGLPGISGYEICSRIRETKKCPVVFLTSMDKPENELMGFAVGADDFIRKPFNPAVLLARVARLLKTRIEVTIQCGRLELDTARLEAKNGEAKTSLSKTEFAILKILAESGGVASQKEIVERLWDNEAYIDENTLYVNINRLREKLKEIGLGDIIKTVRGAGYLLGE
ncbi:MAG: response regulator transcription factor [Firmicutes bacterium]|nr:response regulator transcription factor [Bacillota bacterium]